MINVLQPVEVHIFWDRIKPLIDKALKTELYTAEDLKESCMKGLIRVYVANDFQSVCTVELMNYPQKKVALIHTLGGEGLNEWQDEMLEMIISDSKENGATALLINGRRGWLKQVKGFKEKHTTMMREI